MPLTELRNIVLDEISLVDKGDDPEAKIRLFKRGKTKDVDGKALPASSFAFVPDPEKPSTWKLPIHDARHVGMAVAALGAGFRGRKVQLPQADRTKVKARVRAAWRKFHPGDEEIPAAIKRAFSEALVAVLKGEGDAQSFEEILENSDARLAVLEAMDRIWGMFNALQGAVESIMSDDEVKDKKGAIQESLDQFSTAMREAVPTVKADATGDDDMADEALKKQIEELQKKLDDEVAARKAAEAELEKLKAGDGDGGDDVTKGLSEEARKRFEAQEARIAKQDEELLKLREAREKEEVRKHLADVADGVPNTDDDAFRKAYRSLDPDGRAAMDKVLGGAKEAFAQVVGKEIGKGGEGSQGTALEEATQKAQELMEKDPKMFSTIYKARDHVWNTNPDLKKRYDAERAQSH